MLWAAQSYQILNNLNSVLVCGLEVKTVDMSRLPQVPSSAAKRGGSPGLLARG